VAYKWSSQYFEPADGLPYIGHLPGNDEHVYVATGYSGNGMIYGTVASRIIADIILKRENDYKDLFSPSRIKIVAGFSEFVSHNADVVKQLIGKWFSVEELEEVAALAPGEGKVVTFNDHLMALSKDDNGQLHAVSPACTHMKCSVAWNGSEKSWDCPCHGARYAANGKVLTGPATKNLTPINIGQMEEKS
jgi:nitrite reductase/ring-hydroxylating ferredoxin subunit